MTDTFDIGDVVRISVSFAVSGVYTDPTTVTLKVKDPSGTVDTYTYALSQVTKSATGVYYKDLTIDEAGTWRYEWTGTGSCAAVEEGQVYARKTRVP